MDTLIPTYPETEDRLGMTDEQWAQWQAYTRGYGEQDENGVDLSLLRENLKLTPWERLRKNQRGMPSRRSDGVQLGSDAQQVLAAMAAANVQFVLIGQTAMFLQGAEGLTQDIDFAYARDLRNIDALFQALEPLHPRLRGAPSGLPFSWSVPTLRNCINLTLETDAGSVDLYSALHGITSFEALWQASTVSNQQGISVHVASLDDLIAMKRAVNRPKEQLQLLELEALHRLAPQAEAGE